MDRWQLLKKEQNKVNFSELFLDQKFNAIQLLAIDNIIQQVKNQNDTIADMLLLCLFRLIKNNRVMEELLDICLRPQALQNKELGTISTQHTYKAFEVVSCLEIQRFSEYLLGINKKQQSQQQQVVTQSEPPLLTKILYALKSRNLLCETPLSNMCKIAINICSQKPKQFLKIFYDNRTNIVECLYHHFYSCAVLELFIRILQVQDSNSFYQTEKLKIYQNFTKAMEKEWQFQEIIDNLENYKSLLSSLYEKTQDIYQKQKYIKLAKLIFPHKFPVQPLLSKAVKLIQLNEQQPELLSSILKILEIYLHFHNSYKQNMQSYTNINKSILNISSNKSNTDNRNMVGLDASVVLDLALDSEILTAIRELVLTLFLKQNHLQNHNKSSQHMGVVFAKLRLLRTIMFVLQTSQNAFVQNIINAQIIEFLLNLLIVKRNSTILHNIIKDLLVRAMLISYCHVVPLLLSPSTRFMSLVLEMEPTNSKDKQFENQLYHIFQVIIKKGEDQKNKQCLEIYSKKNEQIFEAGLKKIKEKEKYHAQLIGGDPRKQGSVWGDYDQEDKIFATTDLRDAKDTKDGKNDKKINEESLSPNGNQLIQGNIQHWFDCGGLPLDSDQSKDEESPQKQIEVIEVSSPVCVKILGDFELKQQNQQTKKQNQLSARLKNIGIKQCVQQEIRIPVKKENKSTSSQKKSSKESQPMSDQVIEKNDSVLVNSNSSYRQCKVEAIDKVQQQLQDQIKKLQNKRLNQTNAKDQYEQEILERLKKKVDSLESQEIPSILSNGHQNQPMMIAQLMDLSSDRQKSLPIFSQNSLNIVGDHQKIQEEPQNQSKNITSQKKEPNKDIKSTQIVVASNQPKREEKSPQKNKKQGENSYFPTYLSFQIDEILAELD